MVRFGVIGTGRISDWVLKGASQDPRIKVTAVCSRSIEAAEAFVSRNPLAAGAKIYTSVIEMVADPEVDAVYIGTPNPTHCEFTLTCLNAGKAVLEYPEMSATLTWSKTFDSFQATEIAGEGGNNGQVA